MRGMRMMRMNARQREAEPRRRNEKQPVNRLLRLRQADSAGELLETRVALKTYEFRINLQIDHPLIVIVVGLFQENAWSLSPRPV